MYVRIYISKHVCMDIYKHIWIFKERNKERNKEKRKRERNICMYVCMYVCIFTQKISYINFDLLISYFSIRS
jgi:hypothetical protein